MSGGLLDSLDDGREGVAEDHRSPGAEVVDVAVAVRVPEICALGAHYEGGIAADGAEGADGRVDAAGEELFCALLQLAGAIECSHRFQYRHSPPGTRPHRPDHMGSSVRRHGVFSDSRPMP